MEDIINLGGSVKALGNGKVGGYLVRFSGPNDPDASPYRDYFTSETDFGLSENTKSAVLYHHGQDATIKGRRLAQGEMRIDDVGVWIETQLAQKDAYDQAIYSMASKGLLGWSSGTAEHLIVREAVKSASGLVSNKILTWPLGLDASLTPTPAEPRAVVMSLKSWQETAPSFKTLLAEIADENDPQGSVKSAKPDEIVASLENLTLSDFLSVMGPVTETAARRIAWYDENRAIKQGRPISAVNMAAMQSLSGGLSGSLAALNDMITRHGGEVPGSQVNNASGSNASGSNASGSNASGSNASGSQADDAVNISQDDPRVSQDDPNNAPLDPAELGHASTLNGALPTPRTSVEDAVMDAYAQSMYLINHAGQITL